MKRWMRDIFHALFANPFNDANAHSDFLRSGADLRAHIDQVIAERKAHLHDPDQPDDVLGRLLLLQNPENAWLDDRSVRRNLGGLIVGAVDTTSKFVTLAIDELLRRPDAFAGARAQHSPVKSKPSKTTLTKPSVLIRIIQCRRGFAGMKRKSPQGHRGRAKSPRGLQFRGDFQQCSPKCFRPRRFEWIARLSISILATACIAVWPCNKRCPNS